MSAITTGSTLPTEAKVRLCREIAGEGLLGSDYYASIADRYSSLTNELPLVGSKVLRACDDGTNALIAYLRARAKLTKRRMKRGVFQSVVDLQAAINRFVAEQNANPNPFSGPRIAETIYLTY